MNASLVAAMMIAATLAIACNSPSRPSPVPLIAPAPVAPPVTTQPEPPPAIAPLPDPIPPPLPPPRLRLTRFMAFGDSITAGQILVPGTDNVELVTTPEASYPVVLSQLLSARYTDQRITVTSQGKPAERAELALSRFVDAFRADSPQVVVLLEGYNDLIFAATGALGVEAVESSISVLAADARNRGARVLICTLSPSKPGRRQIPMSSIQAANDRLRVVARGEGAALIDVFGALLPELDANISTDGLHPTALGYRRIAEAVFAGIRADLEVR